MEPGDPVCPPRVPTCLCVLCGLPASGKSTLARSVCTSAGQRGWRSTVVPYDDLIPDQAFQPRLQQEHTEWKSHRRAVLGCVEQLLRSPEVRDQADISPQIDGAAWRRCIQPLLRPPDPPHPSGTHPAPLLLLLDDNFYYPSMRYEVYQLARKYSSSFCQVHLRCSLDSCVSRNQSRCTPVPTEVIREMTARLESPDPQRNQWEANSVELDTTDPLTKHAVQRVMDFISSAFSNPLTPVADNKEQKEADRLKCATSVVHQADQACRRSISEAMKKARDNELDPERMRLLAAQLNESKAGFLLDLRKQCLQELSSIQDEDIDVDKVVKRAMNVFEREKTDTLFRFTNGGS